MKKLLQNIIRYINISLFKKNLPKKISIYFHEINEAEIKSILEIINYFSELDYKFVTTEYFEKNIHNDEKLFNFTFDDAFASWIDILEIFKNNNVKATFYLNTIQFTEENQEKFMRDIRIEDKSKLLTKDNLLKIKSFGHEIGAHTHSHLTLSNLNKDKFENEVLKNLEHLRSLDINPKSFAIPFGMRRYILESQKNFLMNNFVVICYGEPGMQFNQTKKIIQRTPWKSEKSFRYNITNLRTDTSLFNNLTKRSGLG